MIIFLAGVHGVGKTFLGSQVAGRAGLLHVSASELIRAERGKQTWSADKKTKEVDENQAALIAATRDLIEKGLSVLLDGHFVLRNAQGQINHLPVDVFRDLGITGAVLLEADLHLIMRRQQDRGREANESEIKELMEAESKHAKDVCIQLNVPMITLTSPTAEVLHAAIVELQRIQS